MKSTNHWGAGIMPSKSTGPWVTQMTGPHRTSQWAGVKVKYNSFGRFLWHSPNRVEALWFKTLPILEIELQQRSRVGIWGTLVCLLKPGLSSVLKGKNNCNFAFSFPLGFGRLDQRTDCSENGFRAQVGHPGWYKLLCWMWNTVSMSWDLEWGFPARVFSLDVKMKS